MIFSKIILTIAVIVLLWELLCYVSWLVVAVVLFISHILISIYDGFKRIKIINNNRSRYPV